MLGKYRKQLESTGDTGKKEKLTIKARATEILLNELCNVPKDSAATSETIASALECHVEALQNHEHLLSRKGNTYALMQQTRALRKGHGDAPAELASLLKYHDLKDKLLASDSFLSTSQKRYMSMLDARKGLTMTALESMDELACAEETGRLSYFYDNRSFPLQDSLSGALSGNFKCCICMNIINQPREVCSQSHLTCLECARGLKERGKTTCPECRKTLLAQFKENKGVERNIGDLQVRCCNTGCSSVIGISQVKNHLNSCDEEKVECPGKCTSESTGKVLRIPRKLLADHSKECPKHFMCGNCAERFPCSTETKYLEQYRKHSTARHSTAENTFSGFVTSLVGEVLSQRKLSQKQAAARTGCTGFQLPVIDWDRERIYCFAGTDCVRTPQNGVYQSLTDPRDFFVTMEVPPGENFYRMVVFHFQEDIEKIGKTKIGFEIDFRVENTYVRGGDSKIFNVKASPGIYMRFLERRGSPCALKHIHAISYTGSNQQMNGSGPIVMGGEAKFESSSYEGDQHLFKIMI